MKQIAAFVPVKLPYSSQAVNNIISVNPFALPVLRSLFLFFMPFDNGHGFVL
jgi:hypothetical protein